ncbi:MAG: glycine cleavage system protein H [Anaerolineae bacterium]
MPDVLELTVDKFTFTVPTDRFYSDEGLWTQPDENRVKVGLSDYLQQSSGDMAFVMVRKVGSTLVFGQEVAQIETVKANVGLSSPVAGTIVEVNPALEDTPEIINSDPYGEGWLAVIEAQDWERDRARLLDAPAYLARIKTQVEEEANKR